jgi:hypothetical protein
MLSNVASRTSNPLPGEYAMPLMPQMFTASCFVQSGQALRVPTTPIVPRVRRPTNPASRNIE